MESPDSPRDAGPPLPECASKISSKRHLAKDSLPPRGHRLADSRRAVAARLTTPAALVTYTNGDVWRSPPSIYLALHASTTQHVELDREQTGSDETTHAIHESQTLRIERVHENPAHETARTMAACETPVSDRMWVLTATGATPAPVIEELLNHLADGDGWDTAIGAPVDEKMVTAATQPLTDAGWKHTVDGRWIRWTSPGGEAGVQFDAFTAHHASQNLATPTVWAGPDCERPTWAVTASPHTPSSLLADLSETLAHETGRLRRPQTASPERRTSLITSLPAPPVDAANPAAHRLAKPAIPRIIPRYVAPLFAPMISVNGCRKASPHDHRAVRGRQAITPPRSWPGTDPAPAPRPSAQAGFRWRGCRCR
ncbi:DUF317 domain-containing protein [Streptomyces canus]|uniref:DUF317 domain-containing protein n=1 Tax=Streptomyces canus TaxID=58343 RepID=UPI003253905A